MILKNLDLSNLNRIQLYEYNMPKMLWIDITNYPKRIISKIVIDDNIISDLNVLNF
jgi:hypothetical protein